MNQALMRRHGLLLAAVVVAQLCDLATFFMAIARVGIGAEDNGLARALYLAFGASGPLLLKVVTMGAMLGLLSCVAMRYPGRVMLPSLVAIIVAMIGVWGNVTFGIVR